MSATCSAKGTILKYYGDVQQVDTSGGGGQIEKEEGNGFTKCGFEE